MNLADLNKQLAAHFKRQNAAPLAQFSGLSPEQMQYVLYQPLGPASPVRLRDKIADAALDGVPFLCLTEALMRVVQREGRIKLTAGGALPRKVIQELYGQYSERLEYMDGGTAGFNREADWQLLHTVREIATMGGLLRKALGSLTVTKNGAALLAPARRAALLRVVLTTYTEKFNWAYHDGYGESTEHIGRYGWPFSVYLLARFGAETRPPDFYAAKYQTAFPDLLDDLVDEPYAPAEAQFRGAYACRTFMRFGQWFGLVDFTFPRWEPPVMVSEQVAATPVLGQLFEVVAG